MNKSENINEIEVDRNWGDLQENYIRFRISTKDKERIRKHFGTFSNMRDYIIKEIKNEQK